VYAQKSIDINFLYQSIDVIQELDSKQRKIRSFRGFFLYALEIMEMGENYEILKTNLQPFFWRKVKTIIRQNQKGALLEFLFGKDENTKPEHKASNPRIQILEDQIQTLQNQMDSLQQKVIQLETKLMRSNYTLSEASQPLDSFKTIQEENSTLEVKKDPYLPQNHPKQSDVLSEVRNPTYQPKDMESKSVSEASKIDFKGLSDNKQGNIPSNQEKPNFITLGKISEEDKIEIIKLGFQLQAQGTISLKKYYESKDPNSLFQLKGYSIKYEGIRKSKLYKQWKI
jgi:hypothetical protein